MRANPWEQAERLVKQATGGRYTPGSGNKGTKGDVTVGYEWMLEVKQTSKNHMDLKRLWFDKLETYYTSKSLGLILFFGLTGYPYIFRYSNQSKSDWKSLRVTEDNLPETICTDKGSWELHPWSVLYELNEDS